MVQATLTGLPSDLSGGPPQKLGLDVQAHLGRQLRAVFDDMAKQPVPDRFVQLLDALERKTAKRLDDGPAPVAATDAHGTKAGDP
jgi:hypothetical protein